jgi:glutamine synthetase
VDISVETDIIERLSALNAKAYRGVEKLKLAEKQATAISDVAARAEAYRRSVIPAMNELREAVDEMETVTSSKYWPMPTYTDLMFNL